MKIIRAKDYADMSRKAANIISAQVIMNPPVDIYFSLFYALFLRFVNVEFCVPPVPACTPKQFTI